MNAEDAIELRERREEKNRLERRGVERSGLEACDGVEGMGESGEGWVERR